jgi:predicted dehydrogenase
MSSRKRYAVVGTGSRVVMFLDALAGTYRDTSELVGLCDVSAARMAWHNDRLAKKHSHPPVPTYTADKFDDMVRERRPDTVIVTTIDAAHHQYIIRAMELGCDVICEKPMTTDAAKARAVFDAIERTGRKLRVTFNMRYAPHTSKVREVILSGAIGTPLAADLQWMLDTRHGADYFRRWHAEKDKSGGLLVHKSTHHFDMVNWWLGSYPKTVFAMGDLKFYGQRAAEARGQAVTYDRSLNAPKDDPFRFKWEDYRDQQALYNGQAEVESGYQRDRNVFGPHVTIEDTMAITARYRSGVIFSYSLLAYSPWEGFRASITGTKGRLELYSKHGSHILTATGDAELAAQQAEGEITELTLFPMFSGPRRIAIPHAEGAHGGGDPVMLEQIFSANPPPDPLNRAASHIDGAASILMGIAANESMETGQAINVDDLLPLPLTA